MAVSLKKSRNSTSRLVGAKHVELNGAVSREHGFTPHPTFGTSPLLSWTRL